MLSQFAHTHYRTRYIPHIRTPIWNKEGLAIHHQRRIAFKHHLHLIFYMYKSYYFHLFCKDTKILARAQYLNKKKNTFLKNLPYLARINICTGVPLKSHHSRNLFSKKRR